MANQITINGLTVDVSPNGRVILQLRDNKIYTARAVHSDEHVASLLTFLEIAETNGFLVTCIESKL